MTGMNLSTLMLTVEKNCHKNKCNVIPIIRSNKYCRKKVI